MQQILNYTTKVERIHHAYQEQGEINKYIQSEDSNRFAEELKDKITNPEDAATDNKIKDKEEKAYERESRKQKEKNKKKLDKKEDIEILKEESHIDFKV
jgi:hypothetical protein